MEKRSTWQHCGSGDSDKGETRILLAENSPAVNRRIASLTRGGWLNSLLVIREAPRHTLTVYYPYYFQSWRVTAPKNLGRIARTRLITGVNGMSRSTGPADDWPAAGEEDPEDRRVISPRTSEAEAGELAREYVDKFVARRYRPVRSPTVELEKFALIYVPYYVYAREDQPLHRAALVEGFTGALGRVKDVPEIRAALTSASATNRRAGWSR
jgi:hypothetical protein